MILKLRTFDCVDLRLNLLALNCNKETVSKFLFLLRLLLQEEEFRLLGWNVYFVFSLPRHQFFLTRLYGEVQAGVSRGVFCTQNTSKSFLLFLHLVLLLLATLQTSNTWLTFHSACFQPAVCTTDCDLLTLLSWHRAQAPSHPKAWGNCCVPRGET